MKLEDATTEQLRAALTLALDQLTRIAYDKSTACSDAEKTIGEIEDLLAAQPVAVPTGPLTHDGPCAHGVPCSPAPASRDSTPPRLPAIGDLFAQAIERGMEPQAGRDSTRGTACAEWCGKRHDTHEHHGEMIYQDMPTRVLATRCYCSEACRDTGRPLRPTPPNTRGICPVCDEPGHHCRLPSGDPLCKRCRGSGAILNEAPDVRHWNNPSSHFQPCPDCAPQSDKLTESEKNALSLLR